MKNVFGFVKALLVEKNGCAGRAAGRPPGRAGGGLRGRAGGRTRAPGARGRRKALKLKGIDGGPAQAVEHWFNSKQLSKKPLPGLDILVLFLEIGSSFGHGDTGGAWLSSARVGEMLG
ncbi:hypothetical protein JL36_12785 [Lactococcus cremoris]|nr:hypothetical protein JL36_12785 [Lactococcus cremoris]